MDTPYLFICHEGHWHCLAIYTSHTILTVFTLTTLISDMQLGGGAHAGLGSLTVTAVALTPKVSLPGCNKVYTSTKLLGQLLIFIRQPTMFAVAYQPVVNGCSMLGVYRQGSMYTSWVSSAIDDVIRG